MTFAHRVLSFYRTLNTPVRLPKGTVVMNPYQDSEAFAVCETFYHRFYADNNERLLVLGINPGRYGAGVTGIPFTDPVKLETHFGITTTLPRKPELSAEFIHRMMNAFGGYESFFSRFFINSVSPLGFVLDGKNLNYYDTPALRKALEPFIRESLERLITLGVRTDVAFCLGEGENFRYMTKLNEQLRLFGEIIPLAHPRFIMQYRRKRIDEYVELYITRMQDALQDG